MSTCDVGFLEHLLVVDHCHWFNPLVLEGKGKGLQELFEASHFSRAASRELDLNSGRSQSFFSRFSVGQVSTARDRWASLSLDERCKSFFAPSFLLSSRFAPPWTDETCHALVLVRWDKLAILESLVQRISSCAQRLICMRGGWTVAVTSGVLNWPRSNLHQRPDLDAHR